MDETQEMQASMPDTAPESVTETPAVEAGAPVEEAGAPEGEAVAPNAREEYFSRMRELYPDDKFDDEMEYYKKGLGYASGLEQRIGEYESKNQELYDLLDDEPLLGVILAEFKEGKSLPYIIGKYMDRDEVFSDEIDEEDYMKASEERASRIKERKEKRDQYQKNYQQTGTNFDAFQKEHNMNDEEMAEFQNKMVDILRSAQDGLISPEFLTMVFKGLAYDVDMKTANEQGRIDGRNEKIEESRKSFAGDGLPDTSSSVGRSGSEGDSAIARLKQNMARNDVWANGGYVEPQNRRR